MISVNLVDNVFSKNYRFESGILCTYGLNLNFYENYLMKLDAIYSCDNICIFTDSTTYDNFVKESYTPRWLNKKYLVNRVRANMVFHSKLYMFASEKRALIGIGSANLTRDGIASNLELLTTFEISVKDRTYSPLLRDCIEYIRRLASITKSKSAIDQVDVFNQLCQTYIDGDSRQDVRFIHNLDKPILESIEDFTHGHNISRIQILSPFFDVALQPFRSLRQTFPDCVFEIYLQQKKSNFPRELFDEIKPFALLMLYKNVERYLHGKAILFYVDDTVILFMGSANFTYHALPTQAVNGNYEIGLIGEVDKETAKNILCPGGKKAVKVKKTQEIEVSHSSEFEPKGGFVEFIIEAVLKENCISIEVNRDVPRQTFMPEKVKVIDFNENNYTENINRDFTLKITPEIKKKLTGRIAVQIIGHDSQGAERVSNIAWVIDLEEKAGDPLHRKLRRIYNDPFELIAVLQEILKTGNEEELRNFLLKFDVPLDLVLPPRNYQGPGISKSKENIEGTLPKHPNYIFSAKILDAYAVCLERLHHKLEHHVENPQVNKIDNFIRIISSLYSLIWFVNSEAVYERHKDLPVITPDSWLLIRDYYHMLLKFINLSWELVWSKGGYKDSINAKITGDIAHEHDNEKASLEGYLKEDYSDTVEELISIALKTVEMFEDLKETLRVRTEYGKEIKPIIFPHNHMYLQPQEVQYIKNSINAVKNMMTIETRNIREGYEESHLHLS